ncbi:hypothetical protein AA0113_g8325 [Alternaria arborescens]|uniref:Uncharacterized protein n=1 Tax=Alternaria arborescens TaxID=156630 RepID=A0A4Q4RJB6_9PLEO|nr:hypothetical protein AA0113_g8325 [Alternaria arborescens]
MLASTVFVSFYVSATGRLMDSVSCDCVCYWRQADSSTSIC